MRTAWTYALLCAAPAVAYLAAERAVAWVSTYGTATTPAPEPSRAELAARVERLRAEYDDLRAHNPAAKAHKLLAARLALADAERAYAERAYAERS